MSRTHACDQGTGYMTRGLGSVRWFCCLVSSLLSPRPISPSPPALPPILPPSLPDSVLQSLRLSSLHPSPHFVSYAGLQKSRIIRQAPSRVVQPSPSAAHHEPAPFILYLRRLPQAGIVSEHIHLYACMHVRVRCSACNMMYACFACTCVCMYACKPACMYL